jgi:cytochrome c oxidase cbb3-type subunit III
MTYLLIASLLEDWAPNRRKTVLILLLVFLAPLPGSRSHSTGELNEEKQLKNPFAGQPEAIRDGQSLFRNGCAMCHGAEAHGGLKGPSLSSGRFTHGGSDDSLFRTITQGVPGTPMPGSNLAPEQVWKVVTYLRSLSARTAAPTLGDHATGEALFFGKLRCSQCHMVNGRGGRLGPDLSHIGSARSLGDLKDKVREPGKLNAAVGLWWELGQPLVYQTVTVVAKDGRRITGSLRNEDTFSIQLMDPAEELQMFLKQDLKEVIHEQNSLMPKYDEQALSGKELQDLLAYLDGLRTP